MGLVLEFEIWRLKVITDLISYWIFGKQNWRCGMNWTLSAKVCAKIWCFWPLTASTTSEVKNDHAYIPYICPLVSVVYRWKNANLEMISVYYIASAAIRGCCYIGTTLYIRLTWQRSNRCPKKFYVCVLVGRGLHLCKSCKSCSWIFVLESNLVSYILATYLECSMLFLLFFLKSWYTIQANRKRIMH